VESVDKLLDKVIKIAEDKKATDIRVYKTHEGHSVTEFFVVISVANRIQANAIENDFDSTVSQMMQNDPTDFYDHPKRSGKPESGWVVLDLNSIVVHVFQDTVRDYYNLDELLETRATVFHH